MIALYLAVPGKGCAQGERVPGDGEIHPVEIPKEKRKVMSRK